MNCDEMSCPQIDVSWTNRSRNLRRSAHLIHRYLVTSPLERVISPRCNDFVRAQIPNVGIRYGAEKRKLSGTLSPPCLKP